MRSERGKARERERENGAPHCANCFCHFAGPNPIHSHTHALKTPRAMGLSLSDLWSRFPHTTKAPDSTARRLVHVISMCWLSLSLYFYVENESQNEFATFFTSLGDWNRGARSGKLRPHGCATHDFTTEERRWKRVTRETADSHRVGRLSRISHSPFWSRFAKFILGPGPPSNQFTMMAKNRGQKPKRRRGNSQD